MRKKNILPGELFSVSDTAAALVSVGLPIHSDTLYNQSRIARRTALRGITNWGMV